MDAVRVRGRGKGGAREEEAQCGALGDAAERERAMAAMPASRSRGTKRGREDGCDAPGQCDQKRSRSEAGLWCGPHCFQEGGSGEETEVRFIGDILLRHRSGLGWFVF